MFKPIILSVSCIFLLVGCDESPPKQQKKVVSPVSEVAVQLIPAGDCPTGMTITGTVDPLQQTNLVFEKTGNLEKAPIQLEPGTTFTKGQLIAQLNNREAYRALTEKKQELADAVEAAMPELNAQFPAEAAKWKAFFGQLRPVALLPSFPNVASFDENNIIRSKKILDHFREAADLEAQMTKYFYLAPFSGQVSRVFYSEGATVTAGIPVARLIQPGKGKLRVVLTGDQLKRVKQGRIFELQTTSSQPAGTAVLYKSSPVRKGCSTCYFTINAAKKQHFTTGTQLNLVLKTPTENRCALVSPGQLSGNAVQVVRNGAIVPVPVSIVGGDGEMLRVTGIKDGEYILVTAFAVVPKGKGFVAVKH